MSGDDGKGAAQIVNDVLEAFLSKPEYDSPADINSGSCHAFAETVASKIEGTTVHTTADVVGELAAEEPEPWHVWVEVDGEHYDAERPDGVDSWAKLPFWSRTVTKKPR